MAKIPASLRTWFLIHFAVDWLFALPMMFAPVATLELLGWDSVDPASTRLVAAALLAIGGESLRMRKAGLEVYRVMLDLKLIWSAGAMLGLGWSGLTHGPVIIWGFFAIFAAFFVLWLFYRRQLA